MSIVEGIVVIVFIICVAMIVLALLQVRIYQGKIIVETDEDGIHYHLELESDPYDIQNMKRVSFKVVKRKVIAE